MPIEYEVIVHLQVLHAALPSCNLDAYWVKVSSSPFVSPCQHVRVTPAPERIENMNRDPKLIRLVDTELRSIYGADGALDAEERRLLMLDHRAQRQRNSAGFSAALVAIAALLLTSEQLIATVQPTSQFEEVNRFVTYLLTLVIALLVLWIVFPWTNHRVVADHTIRIIDRRVSRTPVCACTASTSSKYSNGRWRRFFKAKK